MKRTWTIIGVSDVPSSFKWYQSLFGQPETRPGHADFVAHHKYGGFEDYRGGGHFSGRLTAGRPRTRRLLTNPARVRS